MDWRSRFTRPGTAAFLVVMVTVCVAAVCALRDGVVRSGGGEEESAALHRDTRLVGTGVKMVHRPAPGHLDLAPGAASQRDETGSGATRGLAVSNRWLDVYRNREEPAARRHYAFQQTAGMQDIPEEVLVEALDDPCDAIRAEALDRLTGAGNPVAAAVVVSWLGDPEEAGLRHAAIRCARQLRLDAQVPRIREFLYDDDALTRITAITALSYWGDIDSIAAFEAASKDSNPRIAKAGVKALARVEEAAGRSHDNG